MWAERDKRTCWLLGQVLLGWAGNAEDHLGDAWTTQVFGDYNWGFFCHKSKLPSNGKYHHPKKYLKF
jgi:hypothetical protein